VGKEAGAERNLKWKKKKRRQGARAIWKLEGKNLGRKQDRGTGKEGREKCLANIRRRRTGI